MTRKDFELIARVISKLHPAENHISLELMDLSEAFANALAITNPLFNRKKFLKACGVAFPQR